jgi:hypothetical protein
MHDVNGKQIAVGDWVNIPCKIEGFTQSGNLYELTLSLKYKNEEPERTVFTLAGIINNQVVKLE